MTGEQPLSLRERKKLDTRKALSDAALELMFERGLENVVRELDPEFRRGLETHHRQAIAFLNRFTSHDRNHLLQAHH